METATGSWGGRECFRWSFLISFSKKKRLHRAQASGRLIRKRERIDRVVPKKSFTARGIETELSPTSFAFASRWRSSCALEIIVLLFISSFFKAVTKRKICSIFSLSGQLSSEENPEMASRISNKSWMVLRCRGSSDQVTNLRSSQGKSGLASAWGSVYTFTHIPPILS